MITTKSLAAELNLSQRRIQQAIAALGIVPEVVGRSFVLTKAQATAVRKAASRFVRKTRADAESVGALERAKRR